jgi:hypothetical protein
MTHEEKLELMYRHTDALGISRATVAPPAWRLLWKMGVQAPPPLFAPFLPMALATGSFFTLGWGLLMWLALWARQGMPLAAMVGSAVAAGVLFGLIMAGVYRYLARKHRLPTWAEYRGGP